MLNQRDPSRLGDFSGGAIFSYEVCRQLAAAGRIVDRLLLIEMFCLRPVGAEDKAEVGWNIYESIASQGGLWNASDMTQQHLRAFFASVAGYHPPPMTADERSRRTAINRHHLGQKGLDRDVSSEPLAGFMEDANMGAIAGASHTRLMQTWVPMGGTDMLVRRCVCLLMQTISKC